jgi:hypothetical protein
MKIPKSVDLTRKQKKELKKGFNISYTTPTLSLTTEEPKIHQEIIYSTSAARKTKAFFQLVKRVKRDQREVFRWHFKFHKLTSEEIKKIRIEAYDYII